MIQVPVHFVGNMSANWRHSSGRKIDIGPGEFRKRVQFMFPGKLERIRFRYTGRNVEAVLDRLPTAKIISMEEDGVILEAEVFGKGILMWILSQGTNIEVLHPQSLRDEMYKICSRLAEMYAKDAT